MDPICNIFPCEEHSFHHQPLSNPGSSIRLIEVHQELLDKDIIQLRIFESPLEEEYTCLSYVWGPESDQQYPILLNGETFLVRENLLDFLYVASRKYPKRKLWIDAICINQTDTTERNHQVQQMGEIYSRAKEVIAWLGDDQLASEFIPKLNRLCHPTLRYSPANILNELFRWMSDYLTDDMIETYKRSSFAEVLFLYWKRAWVTQEISLAQHVRILVCDKEFDLTGLKPEQIKHLSPMFPHQLAEMYEVNMQDHNSHKRHLLKLLCNHGHKRCAVSRDRVFSLLYICAEGTDLQVDYDLPEKMFLKSVLRVSRLTPCLCCVQVASQCIDYTRITMEDMQSEYFVEFAIKPTGVYTYQASDYVHRICCFGSSTNRQEALSLNGSLIFCLSEVCSSQPSHLILMSGESGKHQVKALLDGSAYSCGQNGEEVEICASPCGDSFTIKLNLRVLLWLPISQLRLGYNRSFSMSPSLPHIPSLCDMAQQARGNHSVEYLNLGD